MIYLSLWLLFLLIAFIWMEISDLKRERDEYIDELNAIIKKDNQK